MCFGSGDIMISPVGGGLWALHYWVVAPGGRIIDPNFTEYEMIKQIRGLDQPVYKEYTKKKREVVHKVFMGTQYEAWKFEYLLEKKKDLHGNCMYNALRVLEENPGYRLAIGSMGWRKEDKPEECWFEYGNGD